ncbi:hypothetical protein L1987_81485 [Smallanthus sonchifolius]|uniref:Uncharacterized protein n=1 Tax=Smallanthus sonchifolius TaxID=185202 RepID=A0ACB8YQJ8_9ASTR|nr:hypothetical protein L1987_81485 [Smallanthus sonchifolius]
MSSCTTELSKNIFMNIDSNGSNGSRSLKRLPKELKKSDIYSFGVILLELMSGKEAISNCSFGINRRNIFQWAKLHIENGDIQGIIDPSLGDEYDIEIMWKLAEKALMCVQPHANTRPTMSEIIKEIQDAILIEREGSSEEISRNSFVTIIKVTIRVGQIISG